MSDWLDDSRYNLQSNTAYFTWSFPANRGLCLSFLFSGIFFWRATHRHRIHPLRVVDLCSWPDFLFSGQLVYPPPNLHHSTPLALEDLPPPGSSHYDRSVDSWPPLQLRKPAPTSHHHICSKRRAYSLGRTETCSRTPPQPLRSHPGPFPFPFYVSLLLFLADARTIPSFLLLF